MPQFTSRTRLVITALFVRSQTPTEVAARYGMRRARVYKLKVRYGPRARQRWSPAPGAPRPPAVPSQQCRRLRLARPDGRPGADVEMISWLDDYTRYAIRVAGHQRTTTPIAVTTCAPRPRVRGTAVTDGVQEVEKTGGRGGRNRPGSTAASAHPR